MFTRNRSHFREQKNERRMIVCLVTFSVILENFTLLPLTSDALRLTVMLLRVATGLAAVFTVFNACNRGIEIGDNLLCVIGLTMLAISCYAIPDPSVYGIYTSIMRMVELFFLIAGSIVSLIGVVDERLKFRKGEYV